MRWRNNRLFVGKRTVLVFECNCPHVATTFLREDIGESLWRGRRATDNVTRRFFYSSAPSFPQREVSNAPRERATMLSRGRRACKLAHLRTSATRRKNDVETWNKRHSSRAPRAYIACTLVMTHVHLYDYNTDDTLSYRDTRTRFE